VRVLNVIKGYNTERGVLGEKEQAYISSLTSTLGPFKIVGEGGETVSFRYEKEPDYVYKAFRDNDHYWKAFTATQRADNIVYSYKKGVAPEAERKKGVNVVKQRYIEDVNKSSLKTALINDDYWTVTSTLDGLKTDYHEKGWTPGDTNLGNIINKEDRGHVSVDVTKARFDGEPFEYASRDLGKLYTESVKQVGKGDLLLNGVRKVYGGSFAENLRPAA
jgi:hypothetical protein